MSSTTRKKNIRSISKAEKGALEGRQYEEISLVALTTRAYELSRQENPMFREYDICREVKLGKYRKIDDIVLSYTDQDNSKKLIFVQLKHKQDYKIIDSRILSTEEARAKNIKGPHGHMCQAFKLQKYFSSYLSVRDELEHTNTKELKDGKIKYVVLFTNMGLNCKELQEKKFVFKKAPDDISNLLTLRKSASETRHSSQCYQFGNVSDDLREILKKSSELERIARELAQYVLCKNQRKVMGFIGTPLEHYHSLLGNYVIKISLDKVYTIRLTGKRKKNKQKFREAQFKDEFLKSTAQNLLPLRKALFKAIREIDKSKKGMNDDDLKKYLKAAKWKINLEFGQSKQNIKIDFPSERISVSDEEIADFLQLFVFTVNQPGVKELELLYKQSFQGVVAENTPLKKLQDQTCATAEEFKKLVKEGAIIKPNNDEKWISSGPIEQFFEEKSQLVGITYDVSALTRTYKKEVMQYGKFNDVGKKLENIDSFLSSDCKILCVNTPVTLLTSIKLLQHLDTEKDLISVSLNILNRESVLKAFELESIRLLTIECTHAFKDHDIRFLYELVDRTERNSDKKIILIMQQENCDICTKRFKIRFKDEDMCVIENDSIDLKDFEPKEDPFIKEVIVFQGQDKVLSLCDITGINSWNSYIHSLSEGTSEHGLIDGMTLVDVLSNDEIGVGSKPAGTSTLEGAYAQKYEEINVENLVSKLKSQKRDNDANDMYIISGISGSSKQDKTGKLIQYLGLSNSKEIIQDQLGDIGSDSKIQLADDPFKDKGFRRLCHHYPKKRIFWISVKCENDVMKLILLEIYNPKFYLKRKFKSVIIKKDLKEHLIKDDVSETFIFHCVEDKQQLYKSMELNELEIGQFEDNRKIRVFFRKSHAEADFRELSEQNETVHLLEFKEKQFVWLESHRSVKYLQKYIDHKQSELQTFVHEGSEIFLIEEDKLIGKLKDRKVVIFADDPGMGKSTTLIKLYETEIESSTIVKSHWVVGIKLRDHLEAVGDLQEDGIGIVNVVEFLSKIDLKLNNNLAKNLLKSALDKSENFQARPLLFIFDGFDEVLDEKDRNRILLLLQFIKDKTAAKLWITTRCRFKKLLEETLSTIAIQFSPMDDAENAQYIATYLQHRLYLTLNNEIYTDLFDTDDKKQNNEKIHTYTTAFINKMKSIFSGDVATFIGTPLQLHLMLEDSEGDFKNWIEKGGGQIVDFNYVGQDVYEVYERFTYRKYDVYFQKVGIPEGIQRNQEKKFLDKYHKDFAKFRILESKQEKSLDEFSDKILLAGIIKSDDSHFHFIHKTFEDFFAAKVVIHWIEMVPNKFPNIKKQEYLLEVILMKSDYQLIKTFMNLQLQKMTEQARHYERLKYYGNIVSTMHNIEFLMDECGKTPLHVAVEEGNKSIALFLLNSLREHLDVLTDFLFNSVELDEWCTNIAGTPLHSACISDDVEIVRILLDAAAGISEDTLQKFLSYLNDEDENALTVAARYSHNVQIFNELLSRSNNKLDLIQNQKSALCMACCFRNEKFVEFLLGEFENEDCLENGSLKKILLHKGKYGNILCCVRSTTTIIEKLVSAAKSMKDNNETLKNLLFPEEGRLPLYNATSRGKFEIVEKLLNVAKEIDDDTLKQLLLNETHGESALHVAARYGYGDIINLLLETASNLDIEILEKLITAVDVKGKNAIELLFQYGHGKIFVDSFKRLQEDKYENIRENVKEMLDNVPLKNKLYWDKKKLIMATESGDIQKVKDILSNAKNSNLNPNERLRILLLSKNECGNSTLYIACKEGNTEIMEELLSYAKEIDDDNRTLKQLLLHKRNGKSALHAAAEKGHFNITKLLLEMTSALHVDAENHALKQLLSNEGYVDSAVHVAARWGHFDITKLLLETAFGLGIDIFEELIFHVNEKGKNAIQLIAKHGHETNFAESFKMLKDDYPIIWEKVMKMYDNIPFERTLYSNKKSLIMAIERGDIEAVKDILNKVKNSSVNPNESLGFLLLSKNKWGSSTLQNITACKEGNAQIIKELLSFSMNMDDGGATLKESLTELTYMSPLTPLKELKHGYASEIKQIVDSLIVEAKNNNSDHAVDILEQINNPYSEETSSSEESDDISEERVYVEYLRLTSSEDSDF